jgi:hypothetical protein
MHREDIMEKYYVVYREGEFGESGSEKTLLKTENSNFVRYDRRTKSWITDDRANEIGFTHYEKKEIPERDIKKYIEQFNKRDAPFL